MANQLPCLVCDDQWGIYIPQRWCDGITESDCAALGIDWHDVETCQSGPDEEWYWEAWQSILDSAAMTDDNGTTWRLYQDGDLWEVPDGFSFDDAEE
jgi:hypothetical protein